MLSGDFRGAVFFEVFFFDGFAAPAFFLPEAFFDAAFPAFFLLGRFRFAVFLATFLLPALFAVFFFAVLRAAGFRRAAAFFFDTFLAEDFRWVLLTLRFFPEDFLLAAFLRGARTLPAPARFRFLLAAFLAGMLDSCRSEKNAELYIG